MGERASFSLRERLLSFLRQRWQSIAFVTIILFFAFFRLGSWAFLDYDEATYALVFHESFQKGDFINLTKSGLPWLEKPPLYFWLAYPFVYLLGESEFSLRLVSAFCALLALLMVWLLTLELSQERRIAFLATSIMATTGLFWDAGRQIRMDIPVMAFLLVALYGFVRGFRHEFWFLLYGVGLGFAVLMKSMIGFLIVPVMILYSLIYRRWSWLRSLFFWGGNIVAVVIIVPWHVYQLYKNGSVFIDGYFKYHLVQRFFEPIIGEQSWYYFFQNYFTTTQPWFVIFVIFAVMFVWITRFSFRKYSFEYFSLLSFASIFIIFQMSQTKLLYYLVPAIPFMTMFIASVGDCFMKYFNLEYARVYFLSLLAIGFITSTLIAFDPTSRNAFGQQTPGVNKHIVAQEERIMGGYIKQYRLPVYMYGWKYHESLRYYGDNMPLVLVPKILKEQPKRPFLVLIPSEFVYSNYPDLYTSEFAESNKTALLFKGAIASLFLQN